MTGDARDPGVEGDPEETLRLSDSDGELLARAKSALNQAGSSVQSTSRLSHPEKIGQYRIVSVLGVGGMGTVYEAEQQHPRRAVALKVVRGGRYVDEHYVRLFEREAQTLARLKHPGIAAIYEAGCTDDGQHFFAMELVRGEVLNKCIRDRQLGIRERLALFCKICDAINYAHQRGVIHRDLKPSNVLIDAEGNPKVLDFGLAKITDWDVAVATIVTEVGRIQGTLAYMSPEQARGNPDEIDLRSDVYSLGVILYELVTDRLPYDAAESVLPEAVRMICEDAPLRPCTIDRSLRGDLETIILKALAKEPARRYDSAAAFGEDVGRFLTNQPILARPPSTFYQFRKLVARHKVPFAFVTVLFLLVAGFGIWMRILYRAEHEQRRLADGNLKRAVQAEGHAANEAETAKQVSDFLLGLFAFSEPIEAYRLAQGKRSPAVEAEAHAANEAKVAEDVPASPVDPFAVSEPTGASKNITAREMLDLGAERIATELKGQPIVQARLMHTMGIAYRRLGLFDAATELLVKALDLRRGAFGEEHLAVAESFHHLGWLLRIKGDYEAAEPMVAKALEIRRRLLDEEHPDVIDSLLILATLHRYRGDYAGAEPLVREVLAGQRRSFGVEPEEIARTLETLAEVLVETGAYAEAEQAARDAVEMRRRLLGNDHSYVASSLEAVAAALRGQGDYTQAAALLRDALDIYRKSWGDDHPWVANVLSSLGAVLRDQGDFEAAGPPSRDAVAICRQSLPRDHPYVARTVANLGWLLVDTGDYVDAEPLFNEALLIYRLRMGDEHPKVAEPMIGLAMTKLAQGDPERAEDLLRNVLAIHQRTLPEAHWSLAYAQSALGTCLTALGRYDEAELLLVQSHSVMQNQRQPGDRYVREAAQRIIHLYQVWEKPDEAAEWRARMSELDQAQPSAP